MFRLLLSLFLLSLLRVTWAIVGGVPAKPPEPDEPVIFTSHARVEGLRKDSNGLYSFLGLRYATVEKRFTRPQYHRLTGDVNGTVFGPPCAQPDSKNNSQIIGSEDCLLVNVYSPQMPDGETQLPVLVWIHGGGFRFGSAAQYSPDPLTDHRVVVVALQYRLGSLGILGSGRREFPGNLALLDGAMAVRWVSEHISHFGGDPGNVKVMGHGSGAVMAMQLATSTFSQSLIIGVIAMSGSLFTQHSIEEKPAQSVDQVAEMNECTGKSDDPKIIINCLRERKLSDLIRVDNRIAADRLKKRGIESGLTGFLNFLPHIELKDDDRGLPGFLTESSKETVEKKHLPKVPLLIGVTGQETARGINLKSIKGMWGSYEHFLKNLTGSLKLKEITATFTKPLNQLPVQLPNVGKYLSIPDNLNPVAILAKITEISTDILFNMPATLIAEAWSKAGAAPSFLYQFDYSGKNTVKGKDVLPGLPLVSQEEGEGPQMDVRSSAVAHGDELAYLFDLNDVTGKPLRSKTMNPEEKQVRIRFTKLISDFVQLTPNSTNMGELLKTPFSSKGASFIQINQQLKIKSDFRFCALSMWGAQLQSSTQQSDCKSLLPPLPVVAKVPAVGNVVNKFGSSGFLGIL